MQQTLSLCSVVFNSSVTDTHTLTSTRARVPSAFLRTIVYEKFKSTFKRAKMDCDMHEFFLHTVIAICVPNLTDIVYSGVSVARTVSLKNYCILSLCRCKFPLSFLLQRQKSALNCRQKKMEKRTFY